MALSIERSHAVSHDGAQTDSPPREGVLAADQRKYTELLPTRPEGSTERASEIMTLENMDLSQFFSTNIGHARKGCYYTTQRCAMAR